MEVECLVGYNIFRSQRVDLVHERFMLEFELIETLPEVYDEALDINAS